ncbi:hypothetical protein J132_00178 [Termitomyces sp. J132]|nr:hypothetical protein J132_00178 [Termitomyces sp. J132]
MGWTNSVPIFHNEINFILQPEIPYNILSFIDNIGTQGPKDWKLIDGIPTKHPTNPNICLVLWGFFKLLNCILQCMKYYSGMFSGHKLVICTAKFKILNHVYTLEGQVPEESCLALIKCWEPCKLSLEVCASLGTTGILHIFVKNFVH